MKILIILITLAVLPSVFSVNSAFANGVIIFADGIGTFGEHDKYQFTLSGTDNTSKIVATLVCGNPGNQLKILDPVLTMKNPNGITKYDDDGFTPCDNYNSSIVQFSTGEVTDGIWDATAAAYQGLGGEFGGYTLTVNLQGSGTIHKGGINPTPKEKDTALKIALAIGLYQNRDKFLPGPLVAHSKISPWLAFFSCFFGKNPVSCVDVGVNFIFNDNTVNEIKEKYLHIAHDPPRTDFMYTSVLPPPSNMQPLGDSEEELQYVEFMNAVNDSKSLLDAYITSVERFQGAVDAGEPEYAASQSRQVQTFLSLLVSNQQRVKIAADSLHTILINNQTQIDAKIEIYQQQLSSNGFSENEIRTFKDAGLSNQEIDDLKIKILALNSQNTTDFIGSIGEFVPSLDEFVTVAEDRSVDVSTVNENVFPSGTVFAELTDDPFFCNAPLSTYVTILHGSDTNDYLVGTPNNDLIIGGDGNDKLFGKGGNDCIFGGEGNDYLVGGSGDDEIHGENGDDKLWGQSGDDLLYGGSGSDKLAGGAGNDLISGEEGNDFLWGQAGDDNLDGGTGDDRCSSYVGVDTLSNCE